MKTFFYAVLLLFFVTGYAAVGKADNPVQAVPVTTGYVEFANKIIEDLKKTNPNLAEELQKQLDYEVMVDKHGLPEIDINRMITDDYKSGKAYYTSPITGEKIEIDYKVPTAADTAEPVFDEFMQEQVGLSALASQAAYLLKWEDNAALTKGEMPINEQDCVQSLADHGFTMKKIYDGYYNLALMISGKTPVTHKDVRIIACRGTLRPLDWFYNFHAFPVPYLANISDRAYWLKYIFAHAHSGFWIKSTWLYEQQEIRKFVSEAIKDKAYLIITGHSQGAADAVGLSSALLEGDFCKDDLKNELIKNKKFAVITLAQPRYGNFLANGYLSDAGLTDNIYTRFVRSYDLVTQVPTVPWFHFGHSYQQNNPWCFITTAHSSNEYLKWMFTLTPKFDDVWIGKK